MIGKYTKISQHATLITRSVTTDIDIKVYIDFSIYTFNVQLKYLLLSNNSCKDYIFRRYIFIVNNIFSNKNTYMYYYNREINEIDVYNRPVVSGYITDGSGTPVSRPIIIPGADPNKTPFYIENINTSSITVTINRYSSAPTLTIQKSTDGKTWSTWGSTSSTLKVTVGGKKKLYLRCNANAWATSGNSYHKITCSNKFNVGGNIMSLLYGSSFTGNETTFPGTGVNFQFLNLFSEYSTFGDPAYLTSAEKLILPATTVTNFCYSSLFKGCTSLSTAPSILPATILGTGSYESMFEGCSKLTTSPVLAASTLTTQCYFWMFKGCTLLNSITCLATDISATNCTTSWVPGVAATGTFKKNFSMSSWTTGDDGIPSGWTVVDDIIPVEELTMKNSTTVAVGQTKQIPYTVVPSDASGLTWTSSDSSVTVNQNGEITGVTSGSYCQVTATSGDIMGTCFVEVVANETPTTSLYMYDSQINVATGQSYQPYAEKYPYNSTDDVAWSISDQSVATVDINGKVIGVSEGTATLTATSGNYSATASVNVVTKPDVPSDVLYFKNTGTSQNYISFQGVNYYAGKSLKTVKTRSTTFTFQYSYDGVTWTTMTGKAAFSIYNGTSLKATITNNSTGSSINFYTSPGQVIMFRNLSTVKWSISCTYSIKGGGTGNVTCYPTIQLKLWSSRIWMAGGPITALNQNATQSNIDSTNILYNFIEY